MTIKMKASFSGIALVAVYVTVYFFTSSQGKSYLEKYPWIIPILVASTIAVIIPLINPKYKKWAILWIAILLVPAAASWFLLKTEFGRQYQSFVPLLGSIWWFSIIAYLILSGKWKNPRRRKSLIFGLIFLYITVLLIAQKYWTLPFETLAMTPIGILFLAHGIAIARAFKTGNKVWVMNKRQFGGDRMVSPKDQPGTLAFLMILDFSFGLFLLLLAIALFNTRY